MRRVIYAISSAAIISMLACATSNAAPIAPIPTAVVVNAGNLNSSGLLLSWALLSYPRQRIIIIETIMHGLAPIAGMASRSRCSRMCPKGATRLPRFYFRYNL